MRLLNYWDLDWQSISTIALITAWYLLMNGRKGRNGIFATTLILSCICLFSPLHVLSAHYLFSVHMVVHVILLLLVGPLLIMTLAPNNERLAAFFTFLKNKPILGWLTGVGIMWLWHVPVIFNNTMSAMHEGSGGIASLLETLSLIGAGILFSAPVVHPNQRFRLDTLSAVVYLFTSCIGCSILGLLVTFAPAGTYHHFLSRHDAYGLNSVILQQWGITQTSDQQAAGLIMWVPCCLIYVSGAMYLLIQWFRQGDEATIKLKQA